MEEQPARPRRVAVSTVAPISAASRDRRELSRRHFRTEVPLGVLDDVAQEAFTRGQCHSAAAALAEQPGWSAVAVVLERDLHPSGSFEDTIVHCYAVAPDGSWVDVRGAHEPAGALAAWDDVKAAPLFERGRVEMTVVLTDAAGARGLSTRAGCVALGIRSEVPLLPTSMRLARSVVPAVRDLLDRGR